MRGAIPILLAAALFAGHGTAGAAVITFNTDPFEGSLALETPGRQIVSGEPIVTFDVGTDVFALDADVFGVHGILFANDIAPNLPSSGVNVIVLQSLDNDANPATPFGAGNAANLIAAQLTTSTPGFFIYFNQGLNLPRLVFSTDLDDPTADLKVLARLTNLTGNTAALASFTQQNFQLVSTQVPEPSAALLLCAAGAWWGASRRSHGRRARRGGPETHVNV